MGNANKKNQLANFIKAQGMDIGLAVYLATKKTVKYTHRLVTILGIRGNTISDLRVEEKA